MEQVQASVHGAEAGLVEMVQHRRVHGVTQLDPLGIAVEPVAQMPCGTVLAAGGDTRLGRRSVALAPGTDAAAASRMRSARAGDTS